MKWLKRIGLLCACLFPALGIGIWIYVSDYYYAEQRALDQICSSNTVQVEYVDKDKLVFSPKDAKAGLIFYPGGKVQFEAYVPLMKRLAEQNMLCVLIKMPCNLAVLDVSAADGIKDEYPEIETWYIGGHSLGGSMAASYVAEHTDDFAGLALLAAYSTADLSESDLKVVSITASEDNVMNCEKYKEYYSNLPSDTQEVVIEGGCHGYFGMYGIQDGDGEPTISNEEQLSITADAIVDAFRLN